LEYTLNTFFFPSGRRTYAGAEPVMSTVYTDRFRPHQKPQVKLDMPNDRRTISSGALSSGSSIADAKGCKCSGLCESRRLSIVKERVYGKWGAPLYQVSSHSQSIAEHFEQKCLSDDASLSCGVPRSNTALYILVLPNGTQSDIAESEGEIIVRTRCLLFPW